ncbi:MAG: hypothetical protein HOY76_11240 [Streptomyces sp.]|nr:hypothetical protein [Streptomyces sp.]NUS10627.1 hypothetical protein [Streptomyces sp.]
MRAPFEGGGSLHVALEDLRTFKTRVDGLLGELDASGAAPARIGEHRVSPAQFGRGFGEAGDLTKAYTTVHGRLEQLSRTLADQIEAMSLSLHIGHSTFRNVDLGTQRKLLDLNDRIIEAAYASAAKPATASRGSGADAGSGSLG